MSSNQCVVELEQVDKAYPLGLSPWKVLGSLLLGRPFPINTISWSLRKIDLQLQRGESLGIIGLNGAGKSTLLKIVAGTLAPTSGKTLISGRVAALLELGAGFNPDFSGRENVWLSARLAGLSEAEIRKRFDEIVDFSELQDVIDRPVRTYSSGMFVRLAFSVATAIDPDILIIDEALSVGDSAFAQKSFQRILDIRKRGASVLFCSHGLYQVQVLCDRVVWLHQGGIVHQGEPSWVIAQYNDYLSRQNATDGVALPARGVHGAIKGSAQVKEVQLFIDGMNAEQGGIAQSGRSSLEVQIRFVQDPSLTPATVAVAIKDAAGRDVTSCGTFHDRYGAIPLSHGVGGIRLKYDALPLFQGEYTLDVFLLCDQGLYVYEHIRGAARFHVSQLGTEVGVVAIPHHWKPIP